MLAAMMVGSDQGQESKFSHVGPSEFHSVFEMTPSFHLSIWHNITAVKEVFCVLAWLCAGLASKRF